MQSKTEDLYTPDCIRTFSGLYVNVFRPKADMFCIEDIAHALSMQPRFGGHLPKFLSVAQHSLFVCSIVEEPWYRLSALMHDASEAYLLDIPSPIKRKLDNYEELEYNLMMALSKVFNFDYPLPKEVKDADRTALEWEWKVCMLNRTPDFPHQPVYYSQQQAKFNFLKLYNELTD